MSKGLSEKNMVATKIANVLSRGIILRTCHCGHRFDEHRVGTSRIGAGVFIGECVVELCRCIEFFTEDPPEPLPDIVSGVTKLTVRLTKMGDALFRWNAPIPFPSHFKHYEIRTGDLWTASRFVDKLERRASREAPTNYVITDPPLGTTTYWVTAVYLGGLCAMPLSVSLET